MEFRYLILDIAYTEMKMARLRDWPPLSELPRAEVDSLPLPARYSDLGWLCVPAAKQGTLISVTAVIRFEAVSETSDSKISFLCR
ncbi:hypothetical protein RRG08_031807 [Elysia crispata]|uniref:Uncharacterized protein n=1 Tax=Elysia crispata TaxID=231223 RepID=A0AAE0Y6Q6_9GAST|nr:hypothetical protein RRG08_031807 [Elysia crispata]